MAVRTLRFAIRGLSGAAGPRDATGPLSSGARLRVPKVDASEAAKDLLKRGLAQILQGYDADAWELFSDAEQLLGTSQPDSPVQRNVHACMGNLAMYRGDFGAGERYLELAWDVAQRVARSGIGHDAYIDSAGVACDLAASKVRLGAYDEADKLLRQSLFHLERAYRPNRSCVVASLLNRAEILSMRGEGTSAMELLQRAANLCDAETDDVVDLAGTPLAVFLGASLSRSYRANGEVERSAETVERIVRDWNRLPAVASYRLQSQMSLAYVAKGDMEAAAEAQRVCLHQLLSIWGTRGHPDVAIAINNGALFAESVEEAATMYEEARHMSSGQHQEFEHNLRTAKGERSGSDAIHASDICSNTSTPLREKFEPGEGRTFWQLNHFNLACGVSIRQLLQ
jgi:tetratricopeptide (TPR) repeat protein